MKGITGGSTGFMKMNPKQKHDAKLRKRDEAKARAKWMANHERIKAEAKANKESEQDSKPILVKKA